MFLFARFNGNIAFLAKNKAGNVIGFRYTNSFG